MKGQSDDFRDLYRIMQVHHLAETEVIEGAYKRLSKKYHPDTNRDAGSEAKMKLINYAYDILSDPEKRREYDVVYNHRLEERKKLINNHTFNKDELLVEQAMQIVRNYFDGLAAGEFEQAYNLISNEDKRYISKKEFLEWQKAVAALYDIGEYQGVHFKTVSGKNTGNKAFSVIVEFNITLTERDKVTGKLHQVEFSRIVVREKSYLKMYLGYKDIQSITAKLHLLLHEQQNSDEGYYDKQKLNLEIEREIARANRYNRPFSVLLLDAVNNCHEEEIFVEADAFDAVFIKILLEIRKKLRNTDCCGRWSRNRIMIILPETRVFAATKATEKIFSVVKKVLSLEGGENQLYFSAGIVQYKQGCLQELVDLAVANVLAARNKGEWRIVF